MSAATRVGVDVGGTFTDLVAIRDGGFTSTKVVSASGRSVPGRARCDRSLRGRNPRHHVDLPRHDRGDKRVARAPRRPHGARHDRRLPRRDRDRPADPAALYDLRSGPPPLVPRELRFTVRERSDPRESAQLDEQARRGGGDPRGRRRGGGGVLLVLVPGPEHESACARRCAQRCPTCASRTRATCCRSSASTSASRPRRPTPTSATARRLPGGAVPGGSEVRGFLAAS